ncbi:Core-2/I-Branching enzyme [Carex littledalei]|uniref:Core-2/I-Branching enzyme n=1 Tax=Carex littledalei TaxID=544730 RepID=A0A833QVQ5_9POAL|nr:Core-2/I-Branching enzyme [Carex littledalei]
MKAMQPSSPRKGLKFLSVFSVLGLGFIVLSLFMTGYFDFQTVVIQARTRFDPVIDTPTLNLNRWIKLPSNPMHNMTEEEVFWRASLVPKVNNYPFKRVPKVAFMFLTRGPLPLHPLWERFFQRHDGLFSIYVHALPGYVPEFGRKSVFYQRQIPSQPAEWGKMNMCEAERRLLANALLDWSNERFVLLSESCIPLFPFPVVYKYLIEAKYSFVGSFIDPGPHGRGRYNPRMAPEVNVSQWRKGSQWFEVQRTLAVNMISDTKYYLKFKEFCRPPCYVDEHYFPTMLAIESPSLISGRSVTWVDWSRGGSHPATFGKGDVTEAFLKRVKEEPKCRYNGNESSVCFLFARKFAPSTLEPLLRFSSGVLGFSTR